MSLQVPSPHSLPPRSEATRRPAPGGPAGADAGQGPWYIANKVSAPGKRRSSLSAESRVERRERYSRRAQSSRWLISEAIAAALPEDVEEVEQGVFLNQRTGELFDPGWVRPPRPARCSWRVGSQVSVHGSPEGGARSHFSGVERCGSVWSCPVCASVIRPERAREISKAVEGHQAAGGSVVFVTLTLRHQKSDPLALTLDTALLGWKKLMSHRRWSGVHGMKNRYDVQGYIRATEVTYGANGWHPHLHVLLMTGRNLADGEVQSLGDEMHSLWSSYAHQRTGRAPTREHGIDVQRVDTKGRVLAQYLGKIQDDHKAKWTVSAELARADVKIGHGDSITPFQLLDDDTGLPPAQRLRLWTEYVAGTKGRRCITWSRGLKDRYDVAERDDQDILDDVEAAPPVWVTDASSWDTARRSKGSHALVDVLDAAERGKWSRVAEILPGFLAPPGWKPAHHSGHDPDME